MKRSLQNLLLYGYHLVRSTGIFSTWMGWKGYAAAYRFYKDISDRDFVALRRYVPPGSYVIDVGANVGWSSLVLARWVGNSGRVIAIEPEPKNIEALRHVIETSGFSSQVKILEAAAADNPGMLHLSINPDNPGDHRLAEQGLTVSVVTLDDVVRQSAWHSLALIKIDVQGAESLVLRGAQHILTQMKPALFIEVYEQGLQSFGSSTVELIHFLDAHGYLPFLLRSRGPELASVSDIREACRSLGYTDVLFLPRNESATPEVDS